MTEEPSAAVSHAPVTPKPNIAELLDRDIKLASPPDLYLKLNELLDDPTKNMRDAAQVIEHDPGFTARLLRIVNSAFYGFPAKISSVQQSVSIIGLHELRDLALSTLVVNQFSAPARGVINMREFWSASVRDALVARLLTRHHPEGRALRAVFPSAMLHEIGRLVMGLQLPEMAQAAADLAAEREIGGLEAEHLVFGFDHYQVGTELVRRWRLPDAIVATLEFSQNPNMAPFYAQEATVVFLAHYLARGGDIEGAGQVFRFLDIDKGVAESVLAEAETQFTHLFRMLFGK